MPCCTLSCWKPLLSTYISITVVHENVHPLISDRKLIDKHIRLEMPVTRHSLSAFAQGHRYKELVIQGFGYIVADGLKKLLNKQMGHHRRIEMPRRLRNAYFQNICDGTER